MDMFENMFKEVKNDKSKKTTNFKSEKEKKINLFKETPNKREIDPENINYVNDVAILLYDNQPLSDNIKERFGKIFKLFNSKNINIRIMCINSNELLPIIETSYNPKRVNLIKPWEKYCNIRKFRTWLPSNINIEYAANYVPNFDKLPTGLKYIKASYLTLLTSYTGKHLVKYALVYDPFYNKKDKIDYKKSKDTFDFYRIVKAIEGISIFNVYLDDDLKTFLKLISE